jgi:hypothetical protein
MWSAQAFAPRPVTPQRAAGPESGVVIPTTTSVSVTPRISAALPLTGMVKMSATRIPIEKNAFFMLISFRKKKFIQILNRNTLKNWCLFVNAKNRWIQDMGFESFAARSEHRFIDKGLGFKSLQKKERLMGI